MIFFYSPMSRFSPGGLLGHHPGLSPGLGGHPGHPHHLPHAIKHEPGSHYDRKHHSDHKESSPSKFLTLFYDLNNFYEIDPPHTQLVE